MEIDIQNIYHVIPIDDFTEHNTRCWPTGFGSFVCHCDCNPEHKEIPPSGMTIIHNSFDGREGLEWAKEILSQ